MMVAPMASSDHDLQSLEIAEGPRRAVQALLDRPPVVQKLLDAARECVLDRGVSRVTMSDVARAADVSRTTLYRHYPDVEAVLRDLMTLDFGRVVLHAGAEAGHLKTGSARLSAMLVGGARGLRHHELFRKVLDVDPEYVLPYITARMGQSHYLIATLIEAAVVAGQADGSIREEDPGLLARLMLLQGQALVVSVGALSEGDQEYEVRLLELAQQAIDAQLRPDAER
jgi:AcrR family transcriptional regulator